MSFFKVSRALMREEMLNFSETFMIHKAIVFASANLASLLRFPYIHSNNSAGGITSSSASMRISSIPVTYNKKKKIKTNLQKKKKKFTRDFKASKQ